MKFFMTCSQHKPSSIKIIKLDSYLIHVKNLSVNEKPDSVVIMSVDIT